MMGLKIKVHPVFAVLCNEWKSKQRHKLSSKGEDNDNVIL